MGGGRGYRHWGDNVRKGKARRGRWTVVALVAGGMVARRGGLEERTNALVAPVKEGTVWGRLPCGAKWQRDNVCIGSSAR